MGRSGKVCYIDSYREAGAAPRTPAPVKAIAVTGGKGGVGKSVICANLAVALAEASRRVLLFDADFGLANADLLLGLSPRTTLRDVVRARASLKDSVVMGPAGVGLVPGASGFSDMANLAVAEQAAIINGFNELEDRYDVLCVDTASGISDSVIRVAAAAHHVLVVVCDEPTSLADAYAIIKVLHVEQRIDRFQIVTNMSHEGDGTSAYEKLRRVAERFLPVVLYHAGAIPFDSRMSNAVRSRKPLVTAYPRSLATLALRKLALRVDAMKLPSAPRGNLEFFAERLLTRPHGPSGELAS